MATNIALMQLIEHKINSDALTLPSFPEIALRISQMVEQPDVTLQALADELMQDPAITVKIMKVANSALIGRAVPVTTLIQAVTRVGLRHLRNIVIAMAVEKLYVCKNPTVQKVMASVWQDTLEITASALACAEEYNSQFKLKPVNFDTLLLAGLVHNIGALPILSEVEHHPQVWSSENDIIVSLERCGVDVSSKVLRAWNLSKELVDVAEQINQDNLEQRSLYSSFMRIASLRHKAGNQHDLLRTQLKPYVEQNLIPSSEFYRSPSYIKLQGEMRQMLN